MRLCQRANRPARGAPEKRSSNTSAYPGIMRGLPEKEYLRLLERFEDFQFGCPLPSEKPNSPARKLSGLQAKAPIFRKTLEDLRNLKSTL